MKHLQDILMEGGNFIVLSDKAGKSIMGHTYQFGYKMHQ